MKTIQDYFNREERQRGRLFYYLRDNSLLLRCPHCPLCFQAEKHNKNGTPKMTCEYIQHKKRCRMDNWRYIHIDDDKRRLHKNVL